MIITIFKKKHHGNHNDNTMITIVTIYIIYNLYIIHIIIHNYSANLQQHPLRHGRGTTPAVVAAFLAAASNLSKAGETAWFFCSNGMVMDVNPLPSGYVKIAIENDHQWIYPLIMVIFHSYVNVYQRVIHSPFYHILYIYDFERPFSNG